MKKLRIISLIALIITIFISMDLLINLLGSLIPTMNDGIGVHSIIGGKLYWGDRLWTHEKFFNAFVISFWVSFTLFAENIVLTIMDICKKNK